MKLRNWRHVAVITNEFQIVRASVMLKNFNKIRHKIWEEKPNLQAAASFYESNKEGIQIIFLPAEEILPHRHPRYKALIDKDRGADLWQKRLESEQGAKGDIETGVYGKWGEK